MDDVRTTIKPLRSEIVRHPDLMLSRNGRPVKARNRQRTEPSHILATITMLRRLEWVGETLRCTLNHLAMVAPDWLHDYITPDWIDRYAPRFDHTRLPKNAAECEDLATTIGANGVHLLQAINDPRTPSWIRNLPAIHMLREVWLEEYDVRDLVDGAVRLRDRADMPEDALLADTRYDPEAR